MSGKKIKGLNILEEDMLDHYGIWEKESKYSNYFNNKLISKK